MTASAASVTELTVLETLRLRLVDPPVGIARTLVRRFPPSTGASRDAGTPDITVRFAPLPRPRDLVSLGPGGFGFAGDDFYILDELTGTPLAVIPFDDIGQRPLEVRCATQVRAVPFLDELLMMAFLGRGWAPLHASAVEHTGDGVVLMGWPKGGKTGAMLGFMANGATFVGDEWLLLSADGQRVAALPARLRVAHWQLEHLAFEAQRARKRVTSALVAGAEAAHAALGRAGLQRLTVAAMLRKGLPGLRRQLKVSVHPDVAFPGRVRSHTAMPATLFLLVAHADDRIASREIAPDTAATRMAHANVFEQRVFLEAYRAFCFAYPDRANPLLDRIHAAQEAALRTVFDARRVVEVRHPYGHPVDALFRAMRDTAAGTAADGQPATLRSRRQ